MNKMTRYTMFFLLYFAEGSILGYFTALNAVYLLSFNNTMSQIGLLATLAMLPFILKIFLGILSDKVNLLGFGYRKPYIVIGLLIQALCLVVITMVNPGSQFWLFGLVAFVLQLGMALYDTCTDGLALDTTPVEEEGTIQGLMVSGRAFGVVFVFVIGWIAQNLGWTWAFLGLAVLTILPLPFVLIGVKENQRPPDRRFEWKAFKVFGQPSILALGLLGALYSLVINGANEIVNPFLQGEYQVSVSTMALFTTCWGIGVALGGLTAGKLSDLLGQKRALVWAMGIALISILSLAAIFNPIIAWVVIFLFGLGYGFYETVYFAASMRSSDPRIAASMFSILMAVANIGTAIGLGISGLSVDIAGYRVTFVILALLNLLVLFLLPTIFRKVKRR